MKLSKYSIFISCPECRIGHLGVDERLCGRVKSFLSLADRERVHTLEEIFEEELCHRHGISIRHADSAPSASVNMPTLKTRVRLVRNRSVRYCTVYVLFLSRCLFRAGALLLL